MAFLKGELTEPVHIPLSPELGGTVKRLLSSIYGLKQGACAWQIKLNKVAWSAAPPCAA